MDCDELHYWDANKVIATLIVIRKCDFSQKLMQEWLSYCQDPQAITDAPNRCGKDDLPGFLQHRHDQAILSVLVAKHGLETYRNPTIWGNFLKLPDFALNTKKFSLPTILSHRSPVTRGIPKRTRVMERSSLLTGSRIW